MANRKGDFVMKNLLEVVIAVIGIVVLIFAGFHLYNFFVKKETKNAANTLDSIIGKIELLDDGQSNKFLIQGQKGWVIVGWSRKQTEIDGKPDKCFGRSCICICPLEGDCQGKGVCRKIDWEKIEVVQGVKKTFRFDGGDVVDNRRAGQNYVGTIEPLEYIILEDKLEEIDIFRNKSLLRIFSAKEVSISALSKEKIEF